MSEIKNCPFLKKCPFCGGEAIPEREEVEKGVFTYGISCSVCDLVFSGYYYSVYELVAAWNNRVKPDTAEALEAIKKTMRDDVPIHIGSYAHEWHCLIATCIAAVWGPEEIGSKGHKRQIEVANHAAGLFMKIFFKVDTQGPETTERMDIFNTHGPGNEGLT